MPQWVTETGWETGKTLAEEGAKHLARKALRSFINAHGFSVSSEAAYNVYKNLDCLTPVIPVGFAVSDTLRDKSEHPEWTGYDVGGRLSNRIAIGMTCALPTAAITSETGPVAVVFAFGAGIACSVIGDSTGFQEGMERGERWIGGAVWQLGTSSEIPPAVWDAVNGKTIAPVQL